jgi:DNA-binding response OmpR family regulator
VISENLRLTARQQRCLDGIERINGRAATHGYLIALMYPPPADEPTDFPNLLKVTVCQIRKIMAAANSEYRIDTIRGRGYRLSVVPQQQERRA